MRRDRMSCKMDMTMDVHVDTLRKWVRDDPLRMRALEAAACLRLPDWCIAAGFMRNLVWDKLHRFARATPLTDIDLLYFDCAQTDEWRDASLAAQLRTIAPGLSWSVKNQARMHLRNGDPPYRSTADAMRHWVEIETAVGVRLNSDGELEVISPFGLGSLFDLRITPNPMRARHDAFERRLREKRWLSIWPKLRVAE